jgi:hypothetical protein
MKFQPLQALRAFPLLLLCAAPASASVVTVFDNYPIDGASGGVDIDYFVVSESFTLSADVTLTGANFGAWLYPTTATLTTVDWSIGSTGYFSSNVASGTGASVATTFLFNNSSSYAVNSADFDLPTVPLSAGTTYYLTLWHAGGPGVADVLWDQNHNPNDLPIGLEVNQFGNIVSAGPGSLQLLGTDSVPEPASWCFLASGLVAACWLRRKAHRG